MIKRMRWGCGLLVVLAGIGTAYADTGLGVGVKAGTLGLGVEMTKSLSPSFNVRVGVNQYKFTTVRTEGNIHYDMDLKWQSAAALLDWHPFQGSFRMTVGYVFNNNKIDMVATPTGSSTYDINGTSYTLNSLTGDVTFENGGYFGIGWGNAGDGKGFGMSLEVGAVYQNSPKLKLTASGSSSVVNDPTFQANLKQEQANAESDMSSFKWYPQIALGVSYAF